MSHQLKADQAAQFITAGKAIFTIRSKATGSRFTYKCTRAPEDEGRNFRPWFVSVLTGDDNQNAYSYLGLIRESHNGLRYEHGRKAKISPQAPSAKAADWFLCHALRGVVPATVEVFHEGACGRCGRPLTVPESIESGFGPECRGKV